MQTVDKNHPSAAWIAAVRSRFPCEREIDRVLTRKLERRGGAPYTPLSLDQLAVGVRALIGTSIDSAFTLSDLAWLGGGASKVQMAFTLEWERPGHGREKTPMVLRMEPAESIVETSRLREFQLLRAFAGIVPVPPVFWVDVEGVSLPYPGLIYGFVPGVTKPGNAASQATGMGTYFAPEWRAALGAQFVEHLVRIHARDIDSAGLSAFDLPAPGRQSAELGVSMWDRIWEEDADEDIPLLRLASAWLHEHAPDCARPTIVHGDYRVGNFLFTEHDARITAVLDWELARIGDPHQDLAWVTAHAYGHYDDDGKTFLVGGCLPETVFFDAYQRASGLCIDARTLHYYKVYTGYMQGVISLATTYRIARNGKTHQDVLQAWILGIGAMLIDELRQLLEAGS